MIIASDMKIITMSREEIRTEIDTILNTFSDEALEHLLELLKGLKGEESN